LHLQFRFTNEYGQHFIELIEGMPLNRTNLMKAFVDIQYQHLEYELKRGSFRLKGDTLTIWPADLSYALKLIF